MTKILRTNESICVNLFRFYSEIFEFFKNVPENSKTTHILWLILSIYCFRNIFDTMRPYYNYQNFKIKVFSIAKIRQKKKIKKVKLNNQTSLFASNIHNLS